MIHGGKNIENRTWLRSYRGPLAIHAGKRWSDRGAHSELLCAAKIHVQIPDLDPLPGRMIRQLAGAGMTPGPMTPLGVIIGVVDLVDMHWDAGCCAPWGERSYRQGDGVTRYDVSHLVFENPRALAEPIPWRGHQNMFNVPDELLRKAA